MTMPDPKAENLTRRGDVGELIERLEADFSYDGRTGELCEGDVSERLNDAATALRQLDEERRALRAALEPFALLAVDEENGVSGVNMNDPISKWLTIAQLVSANLALKETSHG